MYSFEKAQNLLTGTMIGSHFYRTASVVCHHALIMLAAVVTAGVSQRGEWS